MAARVCVGCTAVYAADAPRCPHCLSTDSVEQGEPMPKITRLGGASNRHDAETAGAVNDTPAATAPAPTPDEEVTATDDAAETSAPDYAAWTVEQIKDELDRRGLAKTGKKDDLVLRLREDDDALAVEE